tara:strand:- start:118 stop:342 length:225 start_codon:yes stop_codon:yes gene_type:complete
MRGKINSVQLEKNVDEYGYKYISNDQRAASKNRLDLNDLLQRMKDEKKDLKKTNVIIFSGAVSIAAVVLVMLSL